MINQLHYSTVSILLLLVLALAGCAGGPQKESAGQYIDNSVVTGKIKADLLDDPITNGVAIEVTTFKGVVQLSGFVDTQEQKDRAGAIARRVEGVESVKNNVVVKPKDETAGEYVDSSVITAKVKNDLLQDQQTQTMAIEVETQSGVVQLHGFVDTAAQKNRAGAIARRVEGVRDVINNLVVKPK